MNMTGDPNQRNKSPMFGFECSYPSPGTSFPRFSDGTATITSPMASGSRMAESAQCLFATNRSSTFPIADSVHPSMGNAPFTANYLFPSTSSINIPTCSSGSFPFSQTLPTSERHSSFPGNFVYAHSAPTQSVNPIFGNQISWSSNLKSSFTFPVSSTNASTVTRSFTARPVAGIFGYKRKTESPPLVPLKQHITEERMAEHMSRLHISSQTPVTTSESRPARERRLYMCEEMQRLQTESIIPAQILEKVHRPCTALVPWRPPIVPPLPKENNNNEEEPDNNLMERSDSNGMDMDS